MAIITESFYMDIFAVLISIFAVIIVYFRWSYGYWNRKDVPTPPASFPFGNASNIVLQKSSFGIHMKDMYLDMKGKSLRFCGYYFLTKPTLIVADPELMKTIMSKDFYHFTDRGNYVNEKIDPFTGNLFSLKGLRWKNWRAKLTPTFTSGKMKMMFQILLDCSNDLVTVMDDVVHRKEDIDIKEILGRFTTDVIGSCAFGIECNSLKNPNSEFRRYGKRVFDLTTMESLVVALSLCFPKVLEFLNLPVINPEVTKFFMNAVKETVSYREENNVFRKDFMQLLIQLKNNGKVKDEDGFDEINESVKKSNVVETVTIEELAAQAFVFYLAGFETSSTALTFCFYELVSDLEIQNKLREEINNVLEKHDGKLTYNAIMDMTYMDKCINETLRKYPPVPLLMRECTQPHKIPDSNLIVDKGVEIFIPVMGIHYDPEYYPDPEKFDPERFSPENISKRHPYAWLPFGEGPRACIGLRFGVMQTKVALAVLLKNYRFSLNPKTKLPLVMDPKSFVLSADGGVWLSAEKVE